MQAKTLISAMILSLAAMGAAHAGNSEPDNTPFQGRYGQAIDGNSRAQVAAELRQARAGGTIGNHETDNAPFAAQAGSPASPAQAALGPRGGYAFGDTNNQPFQGV